MSTLMIFTQLNKFYPALEFLTISINLFISILFFNFIFIQIISYFAVRFHIKFLKFLYTITILHLNTIFIINLLYLETQYVMFLIIQTAK